MMSMPSVASLVLLAAFAGIIGIIIARSRSRKRDQEARRLERADRGFQEAPEREKDLRDRLGRLKLHWSDANALREIYCASSWGFELFLFDISHRTGRSSDVERDEILLISSELDLPRLMVFPRLQGTGRMAAMAERIIGYLGSRFAARTAFAEDPAFEAKFAVFGDDDARIRALFTSERRARLLNEGDLCMEAAGDALTFSPHLFGRKPRFAAGALGALLDEARRLHGIFQTPSGGNG